MSSVGRGYTIIWKSERNVNYSSCFILPFLDISRENHCSQIPPSDLDVDSLAVEEGSKDATALELEVAEDIV